MGKILDTLRQSTPRPEQGTTLPAGEQVSFIEVGPRRGVFEASADVLACLPVQAPHAGGFRAPASILPAAPAPVLQPQPAAPPSRYETLLASLLATLGEEPLHRALLFTAPRPQAGTTTLVINLALTAARQGQRVALVDGNLRRPAVATRLNISGEPGLTDVLAGDCPTEAALKTTGQPGLIALPAGAPTALFACPETLHQLLRQLASAFDLVLVDGPRWDGRPAQTTLAAACDAVFLVVPTADAPPSGEVLHLLPPQGVRLAGCILAGA